MKLTLLTPALAAILGLALASAPLPTHAQTDTTTADTSSAPAKPTKASGTLTAVDTSGNTITVDNKTDGTRTFSIASTAKLTKDKKPVTLADFTVGEKVYISYTTDASGTLTATRVSQKAPKPAADASSSAPATTTSN